MKILFCTNSLGAFGGIERVTIVKANALAAIPGNEVMVAFTDRGTFPERTIHPVSPAVRTADLATPYWQFTGLKSLIRGFLPQVLRTRKALRKVIDEFKPDIVVTTGAYERFAVASLPSRGRFAKIREYHFSSDFRRSLGNSVPMRLRASFMEWLERAVMSRFFDKSYLLTAADFSRNYASRSCARRFGWMWNPTSFSPVDKPSPGPLKRILAIGRLSIEKNYAELLEIWAKVSPHAPGWTLRIIGSGPQEQTLRDKANRLNLTDSVEFAGYSSDVASEMDNASLLAVTSFYEGFSLVITEALSRALPVLAYDLPYGPAELIREGRDGFVVPHRDTDAFARRLLQLISNPSLLDAMRPSALERSRLLSPEAIAAGWMREYQNLIKKQAPSNKS